MQRPGLLARGARSAVPAPPAHVRGGAARRRAALALLLLLAACVALLLALCPQDGSACSPFGRLPTSTAAPAAQPPAAAQPPPPPPAPAPAVAGDDILASFPPGSMVYVTFATSSMVPFVLNWAVLARAAGLYPLLVGSFDEATTQAVHVPAIFLNAGSVVGSGYVNTHKPAFKRMGALKVAFLQRLLGRGFSVVLTDADAVWLRDPAPYFASRGLGTADVAISSDCVDAEADKASDGGGPCNSRVNFNTGTLLVRPTPAARGFVAAWLAKLVEGAEQNISWMRDQPAFNLVAREGAEATGTLAVANPGRPPGDRAQLAAWGGKLRLAVLPPDLFAGGHTFFIQGLRRGVYNVHTTFQFSDDPLFPYGKRSRFRQYGLWQAPEGDGYSEGGRFIVLRDEPVPPPLPDLPPFNEAADFAEFHSLLRRAFAADASWRERVRSGLVLARALNRTLVLPRPHCYCDRSWAPLTRCRLPGARHTALPFECPMDFVVNVALWERSGTDHRVMGFTPPLRATRARLYVGAADAAAAARATGGAPWDAAVPEGLSDAALVARLAPFEPADVLELGGADRVAACLSAATVVRPGHPAPARAADFHGFARYLLDQRFAYCADVKGANNRFPNATGGMVAKHCGAEEEASAIVNPMRPDIGTIRNKPDCPCEWGFAMPAELPVVQGDTCAG